MKGMWRSRGARILVDRCARVRAGEKVLIITDSLLAPIAEALAATCHDRGADAKAATHLDGIMLRASIALDGRPILGDGELLL